MRSRAHGTVATALALSLIAGGLLVSQTARADAPEVRAVADGKTLPPDAIDVKVIGQEGDRAVMMVRNRTPFLVLVYVRGVRMGWLRGYRTGMIRGLAPGYHRVYAHSRWGSASWGPRLLWIPSRWTLYR